MANAKHLAILQSGVANWNEYRKQELRNLPDLSGAELRGARLVGANLHSVDLEGAILSEANLNSANLAAAVMAGATLPGANLSAADLTQTDLGWTDMTGVDLRFANLRKTRLDQAHLGQARLFFTTIVGVDLSETLELESVRHEGQSFIGIDSIYLSRGKIPEGFLRGAGVPENFIAYMHSLASQPKAFEFYSAFISYSSKDREFAERLHADLQARHVRVWFDSQDLKIGDEIATSIDQAIHTYDKLMVILSANSIESAWVRREVRHGIEREEREKRAVLFPIRLDDTIFDCTEQWAYDLRKRHIGDFTKWKSHDDYQKAFNRLLRDLQPETQVPNV